MTHPIKTVRGSRKVVDKWLADLRSGKYAQSFGQLKVDDLISTRENKPVGFCCLGVLIEGAGLDCGNKGVPEHEDIRQIGLVFAHSNQYVNNPDPVFDGHMAYPDVLFNGKWTAVTALNDKEKLSFNEIADLLSNHIEYTD
jgi:hypothetical protein